MPIYEDKNIIVAPSPIEGFGVFANRPFKKGEVVLKWYPKTLSQEEEKAIAVEDKRYLNKLKTGQTILMQIPERYVNSSDNPNTKVVDNTDVALRDIEVGEEITSKYPFEK